MFDSIKSAKILEDRLLTMRCIMKSGQPYVMPMPCLVCRLFAALSVSLALSLRAYAVESLRVLAWLDYRAITCSVKNQLLAESWINYTLQPVFSKELNRRPSLANTIQVSHRAGNSDKIILLKTFEYGQHRMLHLTRITSAHLPIKLLVL
jgi:hypothetical protein